MYNFVYSIGIMKFKAKVNEIFGGVSEYKENAKAKTVFFVIDRIEFNAEKLFALSDLLGTGTIGIEAETRNGGYCETCSYEYGVMELTATGVEI